MVLVDDYILCNRALHERFLATTEILACLVSSAPRPVGIERLASATNYSVGELRRLCGGLVHAGLLREDDIGSDRWVLVCPPGLVTLEDVFRCALAEQQDGAGLDAGGTMQGRAPNDLDVLLMQATIAINQSVFMHLRRFSLDRLKISAAGMFPAPRRTLRDGWLDDEDFPGPIAGCDGTSAREAGLAA